MRLVVQPPPTDRRKSGEILNELPNTLGLVLWQDARHLRAWAESSPQIRAVLFKPATIEVHAKLREARAMAPELSDALNLFAELKADPLGIAPARVASACEDVANWAFGTNHVETAIEWAEVGALIEPAEPRRANLAGRVTRNAFEYERAEMWFRRGISLALEQANTVEQVWGHLGIGRLYQELGLVKPALKHINRGSRLAFKSGPRGLAASAQHDLAAMLMVRGYLGEAEERARRALLWYPSTHPRLPFFGADVGLMLVLGNRFRAAAHVLGLVLRAVKEPYARATILALRARAFAGLGEAEEFAVNRRRALRLLEKHPAMETVARWHLADAQRLAGNWSAAAEEAGKTLQLAIQRNDRETERMTRLLIRLIEDRQPRRKSRVTPELREFLRVLTSRLARWSRRNAASYPAPWGENRAA